MLRLCRRDEDVVLVVVVAVVVDIGYVQCERVSECVCFVCC